MAFDWYALFPAHIGSKMSGTVGKLEHELSKFDIHEKLLEIGTAEAYNLCELAKKELISEGVGFDISKKRIAKAKERISDEGLAHKVQVYVGTEHTINYEDGFFDVTVIPQVLEHVPKQEGVLNILQEATRISNQGVLISLPLRDSNQMLMRYAKFLDPDHVKGLIKHKNSWIYDSKQVEMFFEENNFSFERSSDNDEFYILK